MQAVISENLQLSAVCGFQHSWREVTKMEAIKIILTVLEVIASLVLVVVVLMQSGKEAGLSGAIAGNSESYMSKGGKTLDKQLASATKWVALAWVAVTLLLSILA